MFVFGRNVLPVAICLATVVGLGSVCQAQVYRSYRPSSQARYPKVTASRPSYRLDAGDVVAVVVFGVTGSYSEAPVHMPKKGDGTLPAVGNPMIIQPDGTLPMPLLDPVRVRGLTITQARDKVSRAYVDEKILKQDRQVTLSLMRKRTVNVSVLHDNPALAMRSVSNVRVPADRPRVLEALVESGPYDRDGRIRVIRSAGRSGSASSRLRDGDIVQVRSAPSRQFFTGGDLRGGAFSLPHDRPVNALQAVAIAGGVPANRSMLGPRQVTIIHRGGGATTVPYSDLLRNPNALMMRTGDTLIVR